MTIIATRFHDLAELTGGDPLVAKMAAAPKYAIATTLLAVLAREDIQKSILAMLEAGIAKLPFSPLLIEFSVTPEFRRFVLLEEETAVGFSARHALLNRDDFASVSPSQVRAKLTPVGLNVERHADEGEGWATALAVSTALLMLNIRGVDKQVIEVERLNRQRGFRGRAAIPRHTVLRIGVIFDRHGQGTVQGASGRHMPVHLRAGHTRLQACGEGFADRKPVYIAPVLVNYRPDSVETPRLPEKVVTL